MAKINRFATNEIEGLATSTTEIHPVGMHFDSDGTMFFSNGAAASKKFVAPGKIFGSGADSGDGQGRDTIKLIPDIDMFESASEQYVIIDSANPGAVHIRPGGTLNQSTAQLYIGGTKNYIKIDESTNSVSIGTKGTDVDTEWTFSSTGSMTYTTGLTFASPFPISFQANLNANSFISTGTSASFDGGTGFVYNVNFTIDSLGTVSGTVDEPVFTSNVGYKVGDTFSFGAAVHGIRDYSCEISITDITQITTGPDTFSANVSIDALPALEHIISSAKPIKLTAGTSNFILGTDGTIKLNSGSLLSETTVNLRNAFKIKPSSDSIAELVVYSTTSSGNTAVVTTANLAEQSLTIGDVNQGLKLKTDGNLEIAATSRETGSVLNWKFNSDGTISNQDGSFYVKQSTFDDERSGIFTTSTANLTVGSEQYVFLKSGTSTWSLNNSSEFAFPNESVIAGSQWLSTYPALKLIPDGNNSPTIGLTVYTSTGSGNLVYLTPNDSAQSGMVFGTPTQQLHMAQDGGVTLLARNGVTADSVNVISATAGSNVYVTAGAAGDNQGDAGLGEEGGHLFLESGFSTKTGVPGGSINLKTGSGYGGFGNVNISVGANNWAFGTDGNLFFPDGTKLSSAYGDRIKSNTAQLIINGLGPEPYVLFPAASTGGQLQISEAELSSIAGNLALTSAKDTFIISNGDGSVPGGSKLWKFDRTGNLVLPQTDMMASPAPVSLPGITFTDGTFQTTAYTGAAATVDITNTNGLTTTYYPTFVESRTNGQYMRADVDLTYHTDDNILRAGNMATGVLKIEDGVHEKFQSKSNATGIVTHDCSSGHIFYHRLANANWTVNLTNLNLGVGYATSITLVIEQGATGYYPSAVQIDGNAVPLAWQGNTIPTPSINRFDVVTFSILYDGLYTVLGQMTGF